nr:major facilitator superfamily domain-containing protein 6-like [Lytechinus pictus]
MGVPTLIYKTGGASVIPGISEAASKLEKPKVNRLFLPFKAVYFWLWSGSACIMPFFPVYMTYVGLSTIQTGLIQGLVPFVGSVAGPFWGSLADKSGKHKTIMLSSMIVSAIIYGSLVFLPLLNHDKPEVAWTNITNATDGNFIPLEVVNSVEFLQDTRDSDSFVHNSRDCHEIYNSSKVNLGHCFQMMFFSNNTGTGIQNNWTDNNLDVKECNVCLLCNDVKVEFFKKSYTFSDKCHRMYTIAVSKCSSVCSTSSSDHSLHLSRTIKLGILYQDEPVSFNSQPFNKSTTAMFATMMAMVFTGRFFKSPIVPILDSTTMMLVKELKEVGIEADYGRQRLWGAVAWGTVSPLAGFLIDFYAANVPSFNQYLPGFCMYVLVYFLAFVTATCIKVPRHNPPAQSVSRNICAILCKANILVFLIAIGVTGISVGLLTTYLFLFIAELSGSHTLMGLTLTLTCVSEVPFMYFATKLIEKLGHRGIITLTLFCYALRFGGYSLLQNPWLVLPIELLHGVTFGALWPTITSYCILMAPEGMATTMQTLATSAKTGFGMGIGTIGGGVIYHVYGARNLFRGAAILCLATMIFYWPISFCLDRREARVNRQIQYEEIS